MKRLTFAIASSMVLAAAPANAATLLQPFSIDVTSGDLAGETFSGSLSFKDSLLSGVGQEIVTAEDGLTLDFDFSGTTFTEADDFGFETGLFPEVSFLDGSFSGLNYVVDTGDVFFAIGDSANQPGTNFEYELGPVGAATDAGLGTLVAGESTTVPEPATIISLLMAGGLVVARKKQTNVA